MLNRNINLVQVVNKNFNHLTVSQRNRLLKLLLEFEELFDRTVGDWKTEPIKLQLKPGTILYHGRAFPIPPHSLRDSYERNGKIGKARCLS